MAFFGYEWVKSEVLRRLRVKETQAWATVERQKLELKRSDKARNTALTSLANAKTDLASCRKSFKLEQEACKNKDSQLRLTRISVDNVAEERDKAQIALQDREKELAELRDEKATAYQLLADAEETEKAMVAELTTLRDQRAKDTERWENAPTVFVKTYESVTGRDKEPCIRFKIQNNVGQVIAVSPPRGLPTVQDSFKRTNLLSNAKWVWQTADDAKEAEDERKEAFVNLPKGKSEKPFLKPDEDDDG